MKPLAERQFLFKNNGTHTLSSSTFVDSSLAPSLYNIDQGEWSLGSCGVQTNLETLDDCECGMARTDVTDVLTLADYVADLAALGISDLVPVTSSGGAASASSLASIRDVCTSLGLGRSGGKMKCLERLKKHLESQQLAAQHSAEIQLRQDDAC